MCARAVLIAMAACFTVAAAPPAHAQAQEPRPSLVRIPIPQDDGSLTPYTFESAYPLVTLVYDTLLWRDAQGIPQPWLARSVARSDGGRRLTIRLAKNVRWHDGRPLTAADVAFTFEFMRDRRHPRFSPQLRDLESIEATASGTVVIRLRRPSLGFLDQPLADLPILPRHLWDGLATDRLAPPGLPVGSGPYRLESHDRGRAYRFTANRRYFRARPTVDRITVPIIRQASRTFRAFEQGDVDMLPVTLPADRRRALRSLGIEISTGASYLGTVLLFNTRRAPFDRAETRRAIARALDLSRVAAAMGGVGGETAAVPARRGYLHPSSRWAARDALHTFDEDAARQALRGLDLPLLRVLAPNNDPVQLEAGRQVVLALRRAGVDAQLQELSVQALDESVGEGDAAASFELAIWTSPPLASYDPGFLRAVFGTGAPLNRSGYASSRFDRLGVRVAASPDTRSRRAAVADQLRLLARDAPVVPLFFREGIFAFRRAAHDGWVFVKGSGILDKRSFLPGDPAAAELTQPQRAPSADESDGRPIGIFGLLAMVVAAAAIALLIRGALRRRD